ncbi:MAG: methyl-accepting chemotaxis protein [Desulfovibrionaceae bacterium]|nr:methyl-accepting chemotaxis protein [Desulfovibrionaceae bacterium]
MSGWNNLSVKAKIFITLAIILALTVITNFTINSALHSLVDVSRQLDRSEQLFKGLLERELQHLNWGNELGTFLLDEDQKSLTIETDHTKCAFGRWYNSAEREEAIKAFPGISNALRAIDLPHARLHATAREIEKCKMEGKPAAAEEVFNTKTLVNLGEIQKLFGEIRTELDREMEVISKNLADQSEASLNTTLILGVISCVLLLAFGLVLYRYVLRPISLIDDYIKVCDSEDPNDIKEIDYHSRDEFGEVAEHLQEMVKAQQKQLAFSNGVLNGMAVPCSIFSDKDITIFTNQHMLDLLECPGKPEDYFGQTSGEYIWGDKSRETLSTKALHERKLLSSQLEFPTRKGNVRHAQVTSAPFYDKAGNLLGTLAIWNDTTALVEQQQAINENARKTAEIAASSLDIANSVSAASQQLAAQIEQSAVGANRQGARITETATAMTEMNATVMEIAHNASDASGIAGQAKTQAEEGYSAVSSLLASIARVKHITDNLKTSMSELSTQAQDIGKIIEVINDIADQTNLLALNAAIEAARAGEAGRGFAVVADEVRKLAEKTMQATGEVGSVISGIQRGTQTNIQNVDNAVAAIQDSSQLSEEAGGKLQEIVTMVDNTAMQIQSIATAAEQQSATSEEINQALGEINQISDETSTVMHEAKQAVDSLAEQASTLHRLIDRLKS